MRTLILFLGIISLSACNGGGGGGNGANGGGVPGGELPALTETQKDRMSQVSAEASEIGTVADAYGEPKPNQPGQQTEQGTANPFDLGATVNRQLRAAGKLSKKGTQLKSEMDSAMWQGACTVTMQPAVGNSNGSVGSLENVEVGFVIANSKNSASQCPIYYKSTSKTSNVGTEANTKSSTQSFNEFRTNSDHSVHELMDVTAFQFDMTSDVSSVVENQSAVTMSMAAKGTGSLVSKTEGEVSINIGLSGGGRFVAAENTGQATGSMNMSFTYTVTLSDFAAVGHSTVNMTMNGNEPQIDAKFFINGEEVSEEEFGQIFQQEAVLGTEDVESMFNAQ